MTMALSEVRPALPATGPFHGLMVGLCAAVAVLIILTSTYSFQFLFTEEIQEGLVRRSSARSHPVYLAILGLQLAGIGLLFLYSVEKVLSIRLIGCAVFLGLAIASFGWSVGPFRTLEASVLISSSVMAAYAIATLLTPREVLRILFYSVLFIVVASFALLAIDPEIASYARSAETGEIELQFRGVMSSKNHASFVFALCFALALAGRSFGLPLLVRIAAMGLSGAAVAESHSVTAVIILAVIVPTMAAVSLLRSSATRVLPIVFLGAIAAGIALPVLALQGATDFEWLGRDGTFTGRLHLWAQAIQHIYAQPLGGYGFQAFFDPNPYSPVWSFWEHFRFFRTGSFHNSAVDTAISLGLLGVAAYLAIAVGACSVAFNHTIEAGQRTALLLALIVFAIASSMELAILHHNHIATVLVFYALFAAERQYGGGQKHRVRVGRSGAA